MYYAKNTTNKSFLDMWHLLQRKKVKNNIFMLRVFDHALIDFSPKMYIEMDHDSDEFQLLQIRIRNECAKNIWFYFREIAMLPTFDDNGELIYKPFRLTEESMNMIYLYDAGASFISHDATSYIKDVYRLLWHRHHVFNSDDFQVTLKGMGKIRDEISKVEKLVSHTTVPYAYGRGTAISISYNRCVTNSIENIKFRLAGGTKNPLEDDILATYKKTIAVNDRNTQSISLFDLGFSNSALLYTLLFHMKSPDINWNFYFVNFGSNIGDDGYILNQWALDSIPKFSPEVYDEKELNKFYFI